jgi:hypothetical protein
MRNQFQVLTAVIVLFFVGLGCSFIRNGSSTGSNSNSNATLTDKAVDKTVGKSNIGIPECDEVINLIDAELNNPDDNFVVKAAKATFLNRIKDGIRESLEQNQNDKAELAKTCKEFKVQFDKYKAEQEKTNSQ